MIANDSDAAIVVDLDGKVDIGINAKVVKPLGQLFANVAGIGKSFLNIIVIGIVDADLQIALFAQAQADSGFVNIVLLKFFLYCLGNVRIFLKPRIHLFGMFKIALDHKIAIV